MPEISNSQEQKDDPVDSSPLRLNQLSEHELRVILQIERRLKAVQATVSSSTEGHPLRPYLAPVERRHRRVLLLDGSRGTGKTSLLLTMAHRWDPRNASREEAHDADREAYQRKVESVGETDFRIPTNILVPGRILDFDPLPPAVPLIAGIVQAWRPIAEKFDEEFRSDHYDREDEENGTLLDLWHRLFRVAAVGWTDLPPTQGLIEQVLDQEEQVKDWHSLDKRWTRFLDQLIKSGQRYSSPEHRFSENTVFVIMIDDVDLQVDRIRQLLPALRMLYHERVVFLVAADLEHMEHMLGADFHGQQNRLAQHRTATDAALADIIRADRWSLELARSSIEKVFAHRNRWELRKLSLLEFLDFPWEAPTLQGDQTTEQNVKSSAAKLEASKAADGSSTGTKVPKGSFFNDLQTIPVPNWSEKAGQKQRQEVQQGKKRAKPSGQARSREAGTGARICFFARDADQFGLEGVMTYRKTVQLYEYAHKSAAKDEKRPLEVLAQLISGNGGEGKAMVLPDKSIYLSIRGVLAALHRAGPTIVGVNHSFVLSARPDFVFLGIGADHPISMSSGAGRSLNFTGLLVAKMLEELKYPVDAGGLLWDTFLSHVWTEWYLGPRLSFAWNRPFHPRPEEHLEQAKEWDAFVETQRAQQTNEGQVEKWAYAWIYYQRKWCGHDVSELLTPGQAFPESGDPIEDRWTDLCNISIDEREQERTSREHKWLKNTLPLLARPELGFPVNVQEELLDQCDLTKERDTLKRQRRRFITDAFVAAAVQRGRVGLGEEPDDDEIEKLIKQIDSIYAEEHDSTNPWSRKVEKGS